MASPTPDTPERHVAANGIGDRLAQRMIRRLVRMGLSPWGARELRIVGRNSGQVRSVVVNLLEVDGDLYLVAPRGATQWVRNLRAAGRGELRVGRRVEPFAATEVPDDDHKVAVLRAYLRRWRWEVGRFFDGVDAAAPDADLARIAPGHPVFVVEPVSRAPGSSSPASSS